MQIVVGENEPAESAIRRFRRAVMQANVIPEVRTPAPFILTLVSLAWRLQQSAQPLGTTPRHLRLCIDAQLGTLVDWSRDIWLRLQDNP